MVYLQLRTGTKRSPVALLNGSDSSGDWSVESDLRHVITQYFRFPKSTRNYDKNKWCRWFNCRIAAEKIR